jgi:hypothetical protein
MEEELPLQKIGHHPAVLVFVGNLGRDTTNTEDLSIMREIGRTMLPTPVSSVPSCQDGAGGQRFQTK